MKIDAHQHFWIYNPERDTWIDESMSVIRKDFLPLQLETIYKEVGVEGCVAVQADQSPAETEFLLSLSDKHSFIKGVVGWVDLLSDDLEATLENLAERKKLKGFRHILQAEKEGFMLQPKLIEGIQLLGKKGYTYDVLIHQNQLEEAYQMATQLTDVPLVIDHIAKPIIPTNTTRNSNSEIQFNFWAKWIKKFAELENVSIKISGMVTETTASDWEVKDFDAFLALVFDSFGIDRVLYGSDWPVCLLSASYNEVMEIVESYAKNRGLSAQEIEKVMGGNAIQFYNLEK